MVSIAILGLLVTGCASAGAAAPSAGSAASPDVADASAKPTFELKIDGVNDVGSYSSDPSAVLDYCLHNADGSWRMQYLGGQPVVNIDMLIGSDAAQAGGAGHVATEITFDDQTLKFDPSDLRGGDIKGRSTASVQVHTDTASTTFVVTAVTPDRVGGPDGAPDKIDLTVVCQG